MKTAAGRKVTEFENMVYKACERIPKGKVATYGSLAASIGKPKSARAVGGALAKNPFAPAVPCHRVVSSNLKLTGFMGSRGEETVSKKRNLLKSEGVSFASSDAVSPDSLFVYP